jgi:hypothetical protein
VERFDDGGDLVRQIDREMTLSVRELYLHAESLPKGRVRRKRLVDPSK